MSTPTHQAVGLSRLVPNAAPFGRVKVVQKGPHRLAKQAMAVVNYIEAGLWEEALKDLPRLKELAKQQL